MDEPTWPWRIAAAAILACATAVLAAGVGMLGFHARVWIETGKCDTAITYPVVVERGDVIPLGHDGLAEAHAETTTVYCVNYDGRI